MPESHALVSTCNTARATETDMPGFTAAAEL
jgi:hypothetical protein